MGSGWLEAEHEAYGFPFPPTGERVKMFEEQIEIVSRQWDEEHLRLRGRALPDQGRERPAQADLTART